MDVEGILVISSIEKDILGALTLYKTRTLAMLLIWYATLPHPAPFSLQVYFLQIEMESSGLH